MPPVQGKKVFAPFHNDLLKLYHPWKHFSYFELIKLNYPLVEEPILDRNPPGVCQSKLATVANKSQSQTGGFARLFRFKKSSRVMLTANVTTDDRLINGQLDRTLQD